MNFVDDAVLISTIVGIAAYGIWKTRHLSAKGTAVFWGALTAQALVFVLFSVLNISYLWYNVIGRIACMLFALMFQTMFRYTMASARIS